MKSVVLIFLIVLGQVGIAVAQSVRSRGNAKKKPVTTKKADQRLVDAEKAWRTFFPLIKTVVRTKDYGNSKVNVG